MDQGSEIEALYRALLDGWNRRSADDMAALFTDDGFTVGFDGSAHDNPAAMRADLSRIFAHHPTGAFVGKVCSVQRVTDDVVVLRAVAGMVPAGTTELNTAVNAVQTLVAVRCAGRWRIRLFQNTPAAYHGRPEASDALTAELRQVLDAERRGGT